MNTKTAPSPVLKTVKAPWRVVNTKREGPHGDGLNSYSISNSGLGIVGSDDKRVAFGNKRANMQWLDGSHPRSWVEAHLIAAAPEMLATLKHTLASPELASAMPDELRHQINAVVAKKAPMPMVPAGADGADGCKGIGPARHYHDVLEHRYNGERILNELNAWDRISDEECATGIEKLDHQLEKAKQDEEKRQARIKQFRKERGFVPAALQPQPWQAGPGRKKLGHPKPRFTPLQGELLAFIHAYTVAHRLAPSEH
jgi:hypothetical protein